ncbi:MAG TPA: HupE/UreJ family protein [Caldimonas sp.]|nr:HupE/UreJ family protein [Caldimonas sp.]
MRPRIRLSRAAQRSLGWLLAIGLALLLVPAAHAHKASDAYLQVEERTSGLAVRWDIALRDLDAALELDADGDGRLTWAEVRSAWPRIERYALDRLRIAGCPLSPAGRALERRNDGAYAVLEMTAPCHPSGALVIDYSLLREVDPTHRGIARIRQQGRDLMVRVLDPTDSTHTAKAPAPVATVEASAPRTDAIEATRPSSDLASRAAADGRDPALGFAKEGVRHILTGYDHVLFLLCLLLPAVMRRTPDGWRPVERLSQAVWPVVGIVSAFTVAHSITLGLAATKTVSLPPAFIEPAIAVTIVLAALDNLRPVFPVRRVVVTFCFGLVHGFGFASVLSELDLPPARFAWALLQFNLGLEAGQLLIVVGVTALLFLVRALPRYPAWAIRGGSAAAIVVGVLWFVERTANVSILGL